MSNAAMVMIVDDDVDIRDLMKIFLEADGYCVSVAADGVDAFEQLRSGVRPALILLDLMMPRMDGEQFLKQMRGSRFANIPVVIMSGHCAVLKKSDELNVVCLMKPVEFSELLSTVKRFMPACSKDDAA
jgi:DNA-binding response OmpR family regulator